MMTFVYRSRNSQVSCKGKDQLQSRWVWKVANDHYKKRWAVFPAQAGMSLTKLSLAGTKLFPARESLISDVPAAGDGKTAYSYSSNSFMAGVVDTVDKCIAGVIVTGN